MFNVFTGVVVAGLFCAAVTLFIANRTSMAGTPPLHIAIFVFAAAVCCSLGFTGKTTETEPVMEITLLGNEYNVTTYSGKYTTLYSKPYVGGDYLLEKAISRSVWGLCKTETLTLLVPTQPVLVYEKDRGE